MSERRAAAPAIARSHGGGLRVGTAPARGTTVTVLLPAQPGPTGPGSAGGRPG
jgi:hypothetical protein